MTLEAEFRQVLAELEMLSYGSTQSWNSSSSGGKPGAKLLHLGMVGVVEHEYFAVLWERSPADERPDVLEAARVALRAWQVQQEHKAGESDDQKRARCRSECEGLTASEAADQMRETARWVMSARKERGLDPSTGREPTSLRRLQEQGLSLRQIALLTGKSKSSVDRALRRAA